MKKSFITIFAAINILGFSCRSRESVPTAKIDNPEEPKIVNIINFVRLLEPRIPEFTEEVLYNTVVEQVKVMRRYKLRGTFLLQYDALMDKRYQDLMTSLPRDTFEIGAWWEIPQPMVENAGMKWRGRYPWDWHANVGFTTGYTPDEREKLADVYMEDFKKIFGYYPESVGCWFIDAHTMDYLYDKYHIKSSCMCRDQVGTDGYTLWGGYWNQAYYPSRINSFMPAQHEDKQLPVPVFRMLGSDPVRQYDKGTPPKEQGVITLEPAYAFGGGDSTWVNWFFRELVNGESLEFNYTQAGQENSFTWKRIEKGYTIQMPLIAGLRDKNLVSVQTLGESGKWFRDKYKTTPATSMTVSNDLDGGNIRTAWFNSRYFRTNLLWEEGSLRIRDIHLFDEDFPSVYTTQSSSSTYCEFFTLPVVDGYLWSTENFRAGIRFLAIVNGEEIFLKGKDPVFSEEAPGILFISWPLENTEGTLVIRLDEKSMNIDLEGGEDIEWFLEFTASESASLPFNNITGKRINCIFEGTDYFIELGKGSIGESDKRSFTLIPDNDHLELKMAERD